MVCVLVRIIEIMGVSRITHRKDHHDGMMKNPPTAMEVRMKLKPI